MAADKKTALLAVLGGGAPSSAPPSEDDDMGDEAGADDYGGDLKLALADLAAALGVSVKDPARGIEALKTIHDLCARSKGE